MNDAITSTKKGSSSSISSVAGILDNLEALRFVQRNIGSFGGDPSKVTVFGESAGASNIIFLLTSKSMVERQENLFQRVFIMSPSHLHFEVMKAEDKIPQMLSKAMSCPDPITSPEASVITWKCLRSKSWQEISKIMPPQGKRLFYSIKIFLFFSFFSLTTLLFFYFFFLRCYSFIIFNDLVCTLFWIV